MESIVFNASSLAYNEAFDLMKGDSMNVLFDLDGTLTDSFVGITRSISYALEAMHVAVPDVSELAWCIGPPLEFSFAKLLQTHDEMLVQHAVAIYRERYQCKGIYENTVYPNIPECLSALKDMGCTLYVATSKPGVYAQKIIDHFELTPFFKAVHGSELDGTRSNKEELLDYIIASESLLPSETYMVGDRKFDMTGAAHHLLHGIGVLWGYGSLDELQTAGAAWCVNDPEELISLIKKES